MSQGQLKAFVSRVLKDKALEAELKRAKVSGDVVAIANRAGFEIKKEDIDEDCRPLSDEELAQVVGGLGQGTRAARNTGFLVIDGDLVDTSR